MEAKISTILWIFSSKRSPNEIGFVVGVIGAKHNHLRIKTFAIFCSLAGRIDYGIIAALDAGCEPERRQHEH
ncbi:Uncharacterised protein [Vibrio furnissii]|nr:Uncharacterised protein [Vibrio furnissii]